MSSSLKLQKRLAASVLDCGKRKVWLDPNEISEIAMANSRKNIRKLVKDGFILRKPPVIHSRARVRRRAEAKAKGRHTGPGKRRGTRNARMPEKILWMRRIRVLRRLLVKYRAQKKIDKYIYHELYMKVKGNVFKNKRVLQEYIFKAKAEKVRVKSLEDQANAHRQRNKAARQRKSKLQVEYLRDAAAEDHPPVKGKEPKSKGVAPPVAKPPAKKPAVQPKVGAPKTHPQKPHTETTAVVHTTTVKTTAKAVTVATAKVHTPAAKSTTAAKTTKPAAAKPATQPATKPATQPATKPATAKPATPAAAKPAAKPATTAAAKPATKSTAAPVVKAAKPATPAAATTPAAAPAATKPTKPTTAKKPKSTPKATGGAKTGKK